MSVLEIVTPGEPQVRIEPQGNDARVRILHFEDHVPDAERIQKLLASFVPSVEVRRVESGSEFERALSEERFDLVLSTYTAPDLSGLAALECAQSLSPDTPFIYISDVFGASDASAALDSLRNGAADFIVKQELDRLGPIVERVMVEAAVARRQATARDAHRSSQEEFVSRISHDLRTPLTAIKASIGVILANEPAGTSEPLHRMFRNIDFASDQMADMVANLAELARLEAGFTQLRESPTDLRELAQRVGRTAEPLVQKRDQRISIELPASELVSVVDSARLERALMNLLSNAMKYGEAQGQVRLTLHRDGDVAVFSVSDDGPGFPADEQVFSPDRRADPSRRTRRPGLGLLIAQALVELHGGRIWIDRTVPKGATVRFSVPLQAAENATPSADRP